MVNDVGRAYSSAPARRQVFVELPDEDKVDGEQHIGELNFGMYGTRDAAQNWGDKCPSTMTKMGSHRARRHRAHLTIINTGWNVTFMEATS